MARKIKIAVLQARAERDPERNLARAVAQMEEAAAAGASVVCTQELFRSPYFCQTEDHANFQLAESIPGPTTERLAAVARRLNLVIVASLFERRAAGVYHNTSVVLDGDGEFRGAYRKMHIPDDPLYFEKFYFTPGDLGFQRFSTRAGSLGVLVCWDQWFPEAARLTALAGAEVLFYPTAIGWHPAEKAEWGQRQLEAWRTVQRAHAITNGVFVAVPNRVGFEKPEHGAGEGIEFWGHSFIADPNGQVIAEAGGQEETVLIAECDLDLVEQTRQHWPFLRDRRVDAYQGLTRRMLD